MPFRGVSVGAVHQLDGVLIAFAGVFLGSLGFGDAHRIPRFKKLQWQLGIQNHRVEFVSGRDIAAALHELIFCVHCFGCALGVGANNILKHDNIAGLANGKIGLRGDDQCECLEIGGGSQLAAIVAADQHFSKVHCVAIRRDRPHHVGQIFGAKGRGALQVPKVRFDFHGAALAAHFGFSVG